MLKSSFVTAVVVLGIGLAIEAKAVSIGVDEIIYSNTPPTDALKLAGTVDMTLAGNELWITLTNTSAAGASADAANSLLTGVGFNLPTNVNILSGSADATGETQINFSADDVSGEWGWADEQQGQFNNAVSTIDTIIAAMQASTDTKFSPTRVLPPTGLNGPEFGLLSGSEQASKAGGLAAIQDSIMLHVELSGTVPTDLLDQIEAGDVVLSFGSSDTTTIPLPSAAWMGMIMLGVLGTVKKVRHRRTA